MDGRVARLTDEVDLTPYLGWEQKAPEDWRLRPNQLESFVMFVGYPRSGHSLVGALLDAHPHCTIAHELDALAVWECGMQPQQLVRFIGYNSKLSAASGRRQSGYSYYLEGQGELSDSRIAGDKKGGRTAHYLVRHPDILQRFQQWLPWPIHLIHVVRDPRDNVATMAVRHRISLERALQSYFERVKAVETLKGNWPRERFTEVHLEKLLAAPDQELIRLLRRLGLNCQPTYLEKARKLLFSRPRQTRGRVSWGDRLVALQEKAERFPWLNGYFHR